MPDFPRITYIWCIVINERLEVLTKPFQLSLPVNVVCEMIFIHLKTAAPSLRGKDPSMFNLYKPLVDISKDMTPSQLTTNDVQVDDWVRVEPTTQIGTVFLVKPKNEVNIRAIICVENAGG